MNHAQPHLPPSVLVLKRVNCRRRASTAAFPERLERKFSSIDALFGAKTVKLSG